MRVTNYRAFNIKNAIKSLRNINNSWKESDSKVDNNGNYILGDNDYHFALQQIQQGNINFLDQIMVTADITAPIGMWYALAKAGLKNFTMNGNELYFKFVNYPITINDFDNTDYDNKETTDKLYYSIMVDYLESTRLLLLENLDNDKGEYYYNQLLYSLPMGYMVMKTVTFSYGDLFRYININGVDHLVIPLIDKLETLPYFRQLILYYLSDGTETNTDDDEKIADPLMPGSFDIECIDEETGEILTKEGVIFDGDNFYERTGDGLFNLIPSTLIISCTIAKE